MSARICPNCHKFLSAGDYYFCTSCASILPKELVNDSITFHSNIYTPDNYLKNTSIASAFLEKILLLIKSLATKQVLFSFFIVIVLAVLIFKSEKYLANFFNKYFGNAPKELSGRETVPNKIYHIVDLHLPLTVLSFNSKKLDVYIPSATDLYIYGNKTSFLLFNFVNLPLYRFAYENDPKILDSSFVVFLYQKAWVIVLDAPSDSNFISQIQDILGKNWKIKALDDVVILTTDEKVFAEIKSVKDGKSMSILLNPKFVQSKGYLPDEGQFIVVFLSDEGKNRFSELKANKEVNDSLKNLVDSVLKTSYNESVIR